MNVLGWACVVALGTLLLGVDVAVAWFVCSSVWGAWQDVRRKPSVDYGYVRWPNITMPPSKVVAVLLDGKLIAQRKRPDLPWPEDELT